MKKTLVNESHTSKADVDKLTENMEKLSVEPTKIAILATRLESVTSWSDAIKTIMICKEKFFRSDLKMVYDKLHEIREDRCPYPVSKNSLYHLALSLT